MTAATVQGGGAAPALPETVLQRRQLHVVIALDTSGSMRGDRIASLNYAMRSAVPELKAAAADNPEIEVRVRVLQFDSAARWHQPAPVPVEAFEWVDLEAGGETRMGEALDRIAEALSPELLPGRQLPPVIVLVSDGYPSDDVDGALERFFQGELPRAALRIGIAIGSDADLETLERFIDHPSLQPLRANNAPALVEHIRWATTAPVRTVSSPTTDPDPLGTMRRGNTAIVSEGEDMVW